jgi:putative iron-only hydrogenase system regulator
VVAGLSRAIDELFFSMGLFFLSDVLKAKRRGRLIVVAEKRLGVIGIVVEDREMVPLVNQVLSENESIIIGRMGVPYREKQIAIISIIINGTTDQIGALTGKLGSLEHVSVKSALTKKKL